MRIKHAWLILPAALLISGGLHAQTLVGEWSTSTDKCAEMRVIYADNGDTRTLIKAGDEWTPVSEGGYERDGDAVRMNTADGSQTLTVAKLTADELVLINDSAGAEEAGAGRSAYVRCPDR